MGYFKRRISRQRCAERVASAVSRQARADLTPWLPAPNAPPPPETKTVFLRFAVGRVDSDSHHPLGVFQAAYDLRNEHGRESPVDRKLRPTLNWFCENLSAPDDVSDRAIFWFKSDAGECVGRIWDIIRILASHDLFVWMMCSKAPGRVVYEDAFQVAAVPHRTRAWRSRPV